MTPILIMVSPYDTKSGARVPFFIADAAQGEAYGLGGVNWRPALLDRPVMSIELMSPELDGGVSEGTAKFELDLNHLKATSARYKWDGAPVEIYSAKDLQWPAKLEFIGRVDSRSINDDGAAVTLNCKVSSDFLEGPLLTQEFTGGGGAGGDPDKRGTLKPAGFGWVENIEPVWFDTARWIGIVDGYGNTVSITKLMEGLSDFGPRQADYPTYAALAAAIDAKTVAPGMWATCVAQGLVGLGAPPEYPITVHAQFGANRIGLMMREILVVHRGVALANIDVSALNALDAQVNRAVHYWTSEQRDIKDLIEALAGSANATPLVTHTGKVTITRGVVSAPVATLNKSGATLPRVSEWRVLDAQKTVWRLKARGARPATVLTYDKVNYKDTIEDKGLYSASETYRAGHVVWLADKSSWLYVNDTPAAGNAPPAWPTTSNAYWENMTPPVNASSITYADGTPIENLKPAQSGANRTQDNVAAAIAGQGALATQNTVNAATQLTGVINMQNVAEGMKNSNITLVNSGGNVTLGSAGGGSFNLGSLGAKALALLDSVTFGTGSILESPGVTASLANFKTQLGVAAAISNQGALATQNSVKVAQMLAAATSYCPDPQFADESFWSRDPNGFTYIEATTAAYGTAGKSLRLLTGTVGTTRKNTWSGMIDNPVPTATKVLLSVFIWNNSNQNISGELKFYSAAGTDIGSCTATCLPGTSGVKSNTATVPANTRYIRFVAFNAGSTTYTGEAIVTGFRLVDVSQYSDGTLVDALRPAEAGANVTGSNIAAGFTGQGPWATNTTPVGSLLSPGANLFPYPRPVNDGRSVTALGWANAERVSIYNGLDNGGLIYIVSRMTGGAAENLYPFFDFKINRNASLYSVSLAGKTGGGGNLIPYCDFLDSAKNYLGSGGMGFNATSKRWEWSGTRPANTEYIRIVCRCEFLSGTTYQDLYWHSIKIESGPITPYTDSSNALVGGNQVVWNTGQMLNTLRPAEVGANVTGTNVAAAIASQGGLATRNTVGKDQIEAGSILTSKLAVIPQAINPDPYFQDQEYWAGEGLDAGGWFRENGTTNSGSGTQTDAMGVPASLVIPPLATATRKYAIAKRIPFSGKNQYLRLRATFYNNTQDWMYAEFQFLNRLGVWLDTIFVDAPPLSGIADRSSVKMVPDNTAYIRQVIYNSGAVATTGYCNVSALKLDVAASSELIVDGSIYARHLVADAIGTRELAANAVIAENIAAGNILAIHLGAYQITADKMNVNSLSAISANFGLMTAGSININNRFIVNSDGSVVIQSATSGQRTRQDYTGFYVFDTNGNEVGFMGIRP